MLAYAFIAENKLQIFFFFFAMEVYFAEIGWNDLNKAIPMRSKFYVSMEK